MNDSGIFIETNINAQLNYKDNRERDKEFIGKWIVLEGVNGVGKSSVIKRLMEKKFMKENRFISAEEPMNKDIFKEMEGKSNREKMFMFMAERVRVMDNIIKPAIFSGKNVITSRNVISTMVYQSDSTLSNNDILNIDRVARTSIDPDVLIIINRDPNDITKSLLLRDGKSKDDDSYDDVFLNVIHLQDRYRNAVRMYCNNGCLGYDDIEEVNMREGQTLEDTVDRIFEIIKNLI